MTLQTKETYNEDKSEVKLGLKLTVWWHRLCAAIYGLFAIIVAGMLVLEIFSSGDITAGSLLALVALLIAVLAWLYWKTANLLSVCATEGWWWGMFLNVIGAFSMNPICLIIVIYLWLNRKMFGVGTE